MFLGSNYVNIYDSLAFIRRNKKRILLNFVSENTFYIIMNGRYLYSDNSFSYVYWSNVDLNKNEDKSRCVWTLNKIDDEKFTIQLNFNKKYLAALTYTQVKLYDDTKGGYIWKNHDNCLELIDSDFDKRIISNKKTIVFLCASDKSLHRVNRWHSNKRLFDLFIWYYGDDTEIENSYKKICTYFHKQSGTKFQNLRNFYYQYINIINNYEYIFIPDDDLLLDLSYLENFILFCYNNKFDMAQPCLYNLNISCKGFAFRPNCDFISFDFIEIQMPFFKMDLFHKFMKFCFATAWNLSGWGYDVVWSSQLFKNVDKIVLFTTPTLHTRPVGIFSTFYKKFNINPDKEYYDTIKYFIDNKSKFYLT